jgi:hypothetical protein
VTPKQTIYCWLIHHGFVEMRVRESHAAYASWWWQVRYRRQVCGYGAALANLLHNLDQTILEPGFTKRDLSFLNQAVPRFLKQVGESADTSLVWMLVQLHDVVPESERAEVTWHPDESLLRRVEEMARSQEAALATLPLPDALPGTAPDPEGTSPSKDL